MDSDVASLQNASEALRRKRERDKQNQRRKRHRDREYIQTLLAHIAHLEQEIGRSEAHDQTRSRGHHHDRPLLDSFPEGTAFQEGCSSDTQSPPRLNVAVQTRDGLHNNLGCNSEQDPMTDSGAGTAQCSNFAASPLSDNTPRPGIIATIGEGSMKDCRVVLTAQFNHNGCSIPQNSVTNTVVPLRSLDMLLETPEWQRLPIISFLSPQVPQLLIRSESFGALLAHMRSNPDKLSSAPETPKAVDLLFGGSSNLLANAVSEETGPYALLPPEKFAISWLSYLFLRWLATPSPTSFSLMPEFCRPTASQLLVEHPICIDLVVWPSMRSRLATNWKDYDLEAVFGLLGCTCRLRGVFNGKFITREADGEPQVDESFLRLFTRKSAWGLLEKFWIEYPELVQDLDPDVLIREEHLLPM